MNGDTKVLDRNPVSNPVSGNVTQPQVGSPNKEAPFIAGLPGIKPEAEHHIDQELKEIEIKETPDKPNLTPEHKKLGVTHVGSDITILAQPSSSVILPMTEEEIEKQLKTGQDDDSLTGLTKLVNKVRKALRMLGF